ncbi:MAG: carbohydrate-binding family 9-like protein [Acidobacteriota bacterium]
MYIVRFSGSEPEMKGDWEGPVWKRAKTLEISHFRPEGSDHRPKTVAKLLYARRGIAGIFRVGDRYVRCVHTNYLDPVYKDSCVGFAFRPGPSREHFNFQFNCGGTLRASFISNPDNTRDRIKVVMPLSRRDGAAIHVYHSLPTVVDPEIAGPTEWILEFFLPFSLIEKFVCTPGNIPGNEWRANLYKCGEGTSHPHWASWVALPSKNIHMPESFGKIRFE